MPVPLAPVSASRAHYVRMVDAGSRWPVAAVTVH